MFLSNMTQITDQISILFIAVLFVVMVNIPLHTIRNYLKQNSRNYISLKNVIYAIASDIIAISALLQLAYSLFAHNTVIGIGAAEAFVVSLVLFIKLMRTKEIKHALFAQIKEA